MLSKFQKLTIWVYALAGVYANVHAQKILSFADYQKMVMLNHPLVKQANLLNDLATQEMRLAKGGFDPKFDFDYSSKTYDKKRYYEYLDFGLKIPTWFGGDLKFGYENNLGLFKNPFDYTPTGGLIFAGIEMPLNSIIFDERRQLVRTAQNLKQLNEVEKQKIVNKALLSATKDYWDWFFAFYKYKIKEQNLNLAQTTYEAVIGKIVGGDMASIDSVEANVNLLERTIDFKDAQNELQNASLGLSLNLWTDKTQPLELEPSTIPEAMDLNIALTDTSYNRTYELALNNQPDILKINLKLNKLEIDKKLYNQLYLPQATVIGKYLNTPAQFGSEDLTFDYLSNNYKLGFHLIQPLFLRKERAKLQSSKIKIEQTNFEKSYTQYSLETSLKQSLNEVVNYHQIFKIQHNMYVSAEKLFEGEKTKFLMGEATLFYLNIRQTKMLDSQIKTLDYYKKYQKAIAQLQWLCGKY